MSVDYSLLETPMNDKTPQQLAEFKLLIDYNPIDGTAAWRQTHHIYFAGDDAGYVRKDGIRVLSLRGKEWALAPICWAIHHNEWPNGRVRFKADKGSLKLDNLYVAAGNWRSRENRRKYDRQHRALKPEIYRAQDLKRDFGITIAEYTEILLAQNGVCAICEKPETATRNGKLKALAVDHDHESGGIRSLLCVECNTGLGKFKDSPSLLRRAADYIEKHAGNVVPIRKDNSA